MDVGPSTMEMYNLKESYTLWDLLNDSPVWQDRIYHLLAGLYAVVSLVAISYLLYLALSWAGKFVRVVLTGSYDPTKAAKRVAKLNSNLDTFIKLASYLNPFLTPLYDQVTENVQLVRIQQRVPEYGWTTQKVFHFLNFLVNGARCVIFIYRRDIQQLSPEIAQHMLLDLPSLVFFTTYALLVLFWAEIYYQARTVSTDGLRPGFFAINASVYVTQIALWLIIWWRPTHMLVTLSKVFFAGVSFFAALGFLLYGGRLFLMLQRFPVESKGRRKKLQEVGYVTSICFACFLLRCIMMCFNAFNKAANLDVLEHPVLNFIYYLLVEILPSSLVLFILRKLPPKRGIIQYQAIG